MTHEDFQEKKKADLASALLNAAKSPARPSRTVAANDDPDAPFETTPNPGYGKLNREHVSNVMVSEMIKAGALNRVD